MSKELKALKKHFSENCNVKIAYTIEETHYPHWKRLCFGSLNCEEMIQVSSYIKKTFSTESNYSHLLPKLHAYNGVLCLTIDVSQIKDKLI